MNLNADKDGLTIQIGERKQESESVE